MLRGLVAGNNSEFIMFENRVLRGIITGSWNKDVAGEIGNVCIYVAVA